MSLPEISRRCVSCGAAVRAGARFCPQCGKTVPDGAAQGAAAAATPEDATPATRDAELPRAPAPPTREVYAAAQESETPPTAARPSEVSTQSPESNAPGAGSSVLGAESNALGSESAVRGDGARAGVPETGEWRADADASEAASPYAAAASSLRQAGPEDGAASEERRGRVARVREEARVRVENTRARVERVKDDALVALEESPDDSGLRFVLVTVFIFALFVFFLLLSVTVLR